MMQVAQPVQYGYGYPQQMQYQQQQVQQQQQQQMKAPVEEEEIRPFPSIAQEPRNSRFTVFNVPDIDKLKVSAGKTFEMKVLQNKKSEGEYRVEYDHNGDTHTVAVTYDNKPLAGTPFQLLGQPISIDHRPEGKEFHLSNVYKLDRLDMQTKLPFEMFEGEKKYSYVVKHQPQEGETYAVNIKYNGEDVKDGSFTLAPKNPPKRAEAAQMDAPMSAPMMPQQHGGWMTVMTPQGPMMAQMMPMMPAQAQGVQQQQQQQMTTMAPPQGQMMRPQGPMMMYPQGQPMYHPQGQPMMHPGMMGSAMPMRR